MKGSRWLWALVWLAVCASVPAAGQRWAMENASRHVELVADIEALAELAEQADAPLPRVLAMWRRAGLTSVSVPPLRVADLEGKLEGGRPKGAAGSIGGIIVASGTELERWRAFAGSGLDLGGLPLERNRTYLLFPAISEPRRTRAVIGRIVSRFPPGSGTGSAGAVWMSERPDGSRVVALPFSDGAAARRLVLGFSPLALDYARSLGLRPVFRPVNAEGASRLAADLAEAGVEPGLVIFSGSAVVGYPHALEETAAALDGWSVGWIEFHRQLGLAHLVNMTDGRAVRVHSITPREMARLTPDAALARWMRAARERGARVLYIRPFLRDNPRMAPLSGEALLAANAAYVKALADRLQARGFHLGPARPLGAWKGPFALLLLGAAGVGAAGALILRELGIRGSARGPWTYPPWVGWLFEGIVVVVPVLVTAFLYLKGYTVLSRQGAAFLATLVVPVLAVLVAARWVGATSEVVVSESAAGEAAAREAAAREAAAGEAAARAKRLGEKGPTRARRAPPGRKAQVPWRKGLGAMAKGLGAVAKGLGVVAAVTMGGIVILVNLLADFRFMLGSAQYLGVKAAHAFPVIVIAGVAFVNLWRERSPAPPGQCEGSLPYANGASLWTRRLMVALGVLVMLAAFAVYVLRTGHGWLPVLPWEQQFRSWLESNLPVRPRSRELFIGYPALVLGLARLAAGPKGKAWGWALLAAGTVAPIAVMNSFAHVHSPLTVSLVRSGLGLLLGVAVGFLVLALLAVVRRLVLGREKVAGVPWDSGRGGVGRVP